MTYSTVQCLQNLLGKAQQTQGQALKCGQQRWEATTLNALMP